MCVLIWFDSSISSSEAVFGSPLVLSGEFLDTTELLSSEYLCRIRQIIKNNPVFPPHHSSTQTNPVQEQIPPSLLCSSHVFVREASTFSALQRSLLSGFSFSQVFFSPDGFQNRLSLCGSTETSALRVPWYSSRAPSQR